MSGSRQRLHFSLVQLNRLKRHQTISALKSFNFTDGRHIIFFLYTRHLRIFRPQFLQFSLFMLSNPPVHLHAARLPVVLTLTIPSCLQVTIKRETTFHLQPLEAGCTLLLKVRTIRECPGKQSTPSEWPLDENKTKKFFFNLSARLSFRLRSPVTCLRPSCG